jgi:hypothetical protein
MLLGSRRFSCLRLIRFEFAFVVLTKQFWCYLGDDVFVLRDKLTLPNFLAPLFFFHD